jgi:hypothetical protein
MSKEKLPKSLKKDKKSIPSLETNQKRSNSGKSNELAISSDKTNNIDRAEKDIEAYMNSQTSDFDALLDSGNKKSEEKHVRKTSMDQAVGVYTKDNHYSI